MKKIVPVIMAATMLLLLGTQLSFAQTRPPIVPGDEDNLILPHPDVEGQPAEAYFGGRLLPMITQTVIALSGASAFLFIILGGIQILTAYGNEEKIAGGKKTVTYAIVGLLIAILSYAIVSIISAIRVGDSVAGGTGSGPGGSTPQNEQLAPGSEDMTEAEMNDPGAYGPGGSAEPIQGGVKN